MKPALQAREVTIDGMAVQLSGEARISDRPIIGRKDILKTCRLWWGLDEDWRPDPSIESLPFRLIGNPGVGKNVIVNELVRLIKKNNPDNPIPFYAIQCHEEMTPEDLCMSWGPAARTADDAHNSATRWILKASGLTTAILEGGIVFLDEINRAPPRCLSMLLPVLDDRNEIFSAMTNTWVWAKPGRRFPFMFCCAMNPNAGDTAYPMPDNIKQRTLPIMQVPSLTGSDVEELIKQRFGKDLNYALIKTEFEGVVNAGISTRTLLRTLDCWTRGGADPEKLSKILDAFQERSDGR